MKKFFERLFGITFSQSNAGNTGSSTSTASTGNTASTAVSSAPTTINAPNVSSPGASTSVGSQPMTGPTNSSSAVVPWSPRPRQSNVDQFANLHAFTAEMRRSSAVQIRRPSAVQPSPSTVQSSAVQPSSSTIQPSAAQPDPSNLQVTIPNLLAFPSSPGLLTNLLNNYTPGEHLNHLENGQVPKHLTWAVSQIIPYTPVSNAAAKRVVPSSLEHIRHTVISKENVLESLQSRVLLPPSPVKPAYLTNDQFVEITAGATFLQMIRKGEITADVILLQNVFRGTPGKNLSNLQYLAARLDFLKSPVDFRNYIPSGLSNNLSSQELEMLGSVVLTSEVTLIHEMIALGTINSQQVSQLSFTGNIRNPDGSPTPPEYYNNSGNAFPDYKLTLNKSVGKFTHMGVDFKFKKHGRGNHDIVKGCSDNFDYHTKNANQQLHKNVEKILQNPDISDADTAIGNYLLLEIEKNTANFLSNKDVDQYILASNGIREDFSDFLIRNKIGVNLIAPISVKDMVIKEEATTEFRTEFNGTYLSENSTLVKFLEDNKDKYAGKVDAKEILLDYAKHLFSNFP